MHDWQSSNDAHIIWLQVFPDWWHPNITEFWGKEIIDWVKLLDLDGLWIDMDEPSSFCLGSCGTGKQDTKPSQYWELDDDKAEALFAEWKKEIDSYGNSTPGDTRNLLYPNYRIRNGYGDLSVRTASTNSLHYGGVPHYDYHNIYGHAEGEVTRQVCLASKSKIASFWLIILYI